MYQGTARALTKYTCINKEVHVHHQGHTHTCIIKAVHVHQRDNARPSMRKCICIIGVMHIHHGARALLSSGS